MPVIRGNSLNNSLKGQSDFNAVNEIYGYEGNDNLEGGFLSINHIWGGVGDDVIKGGAEPDLL
jgi:hypothetical protein